MVIYEQEKFEQHSQTSKEASESDPECTFKLTRFVDLFDTLTAVTTNTPPRRVFFSLLKPEFSWTPINCFHGFFTRSDREGSFIAE